jgi:hypothetical protein
LTRLFLQNAKTRIANIFNEHFRDFIKALEANKLEYVLVGGMAVILHSSVRVLVIWMYGK